MGMQAATVEVLVKKAKFEPIVAIAVAEAIDMAITQAQPVTVPILEAKLTSLKSEIDVKFAQLKTDLIIWILAITLGSNYLPQIVGGIAKTISSSFK